MWNLVVWAVSAVDLSVLLIFVVSFDFRRRLIQYNLLHIKC